MAHRENITTDYDELGVSTSRGFNIAQTVGIGGKNETGDVMLIQAMFKYIAKYAQILDVGTPNDKIPEPSGNYTRETGKMILDYQRKNYYLLLGAPDGIIHPASFEGRTLHIDGQRMTITLLNEELASTAWDQTTSLDYTEPLIAEFPQLRSWLMQGSMRQRTSYKMRLP